MSDSSGRMRRNSSGCYSHPDLSEIGGLACCLICMEAVSHPCYLECKHIFCEACLQLFYKLYSNVQYEQKGVLIPCPTCRHLSQVPSDGLSGFKASSLTHLMDRKLSMVPDSVQDCELCVFKSKATEARHFCGKCSLNYCSACKVTHDQHPLFKSHSMVHISNKETISLFCDTHNKLQVLYFCMGCQQPICTVCVLQGHSQHQTVKLHEALSQRRDNLKSILNALLPKLEKLDQKMSNLTRLTSVLRRKNGVSMPNPIVETPPRSPVPRGGKHQSSPPILQSDEKAFNRTSSTDSADNNILSFEFHIERLKKLFDKSMMIIEMSQSKRLMVIYDDLVKRLETVLDLDMVHLHEQVDDCLQTEREKYNKSRCGSLPKKDSETSLVSLQDRRSSMVSSTHAYSQLTSDDDSLFEMPNSPSMLVQPQLLWKVEKQRMDVGELWNPCDVAYLHDGNLVVAEYDALNDKNNKLRIFDCSGKSLEMLAQGVIRPLGVAVTREGHIAVTDCKGKRVKVYTAGGQLLGDIGKGQFGWPYGITTNSRGQIIVTDAFNDAVHIYSGDGKRIKQFGSSGSNNNQFRNPYHVTVDQRDNIVISDSGNNCFKVFNSNGDFLCKTDEPRSSANSMGGHVRRRGLKGPRGITTDLKGNILIADDRSRVALYSNTCQYIRNLLTKEDSVKYPEALCCSSKGHLVVTEWNPNNMFAVKLFNLFQ